MKEIARLQQSVRRMEDNSSFENRLSAWSSEMKMFKVAGLLVGYFCIAWFPFLVFAFLNYNEPELYINRFIR